MFSIFVLFLKPKPADIEGYFTKMISFFTFSHFAIQKYNLFTDVNKTKLTLNTCFTVTIKTFLKTSVLYKFLRAKLV